MKSLSKNKSSLVLILLLILVLVAYNVYKPEAVFEDVTSPVSTIGNDILKIREDLEKVNFDSGVFSSTGYQMLVDFSKPIVSQPTGRANPFAPIR